MSHDTLEKPSLESLALDIKQLKERLEEVKALIEIHTVSERKSRKPGPLWED